MARTAVQHARQKARKQERKDEEIRWLSLQRMRPCGLCGRGYIANTMERPDKIVVRRWHGVEVCRECQAARIETITLLIKLKILKWTKAHKQKTKWPVRWKRVPTDVFSQAYGKDGDVWSPCDICKLKYLVKRDGQKIPRVSWRGLVVCGNCLKGIRLIARLVELGIVKYNKEQA